MYDPFFVPPDRDPPGVTHPDRERADRRVAVWESRTGYIRTIIRSMECRL